MQAFYNEHDAKAAAWLRELIARGRIAPGVVDERSIEDIRPDELVGFEQCHFFAGIGGWSLALRSAGWPDERPVWTGSCPCQPFSAAGEGAGFADERHLWPAFFHLIGERRPRVVFGEQVASRDGLGWLDLVRADLEGAGYAVGAVDLCAAGFGAPHLRQRLFFVADADGERRAGERLQLCGRAARPAVPQAAGAGEVGLVELAGLARLERLAGDGDDGDEPGRDGADAARSASEAGASRGLADAAGQREGGTAAPDVQVAPGWRAAEPRVRCDAGRVADADEHAGRQGSALCGGRDSGSDAAARPGPRSSGLAVSGFWADADWIPCRDGKARPVEPGTFPLAHGLPARVGRLRGYGNAISPPVAEGFIRAFLEVEGGVS